jgi:hypothetical protein
MSKWNKESRKALRYCFFCDGPTDGVEPHHCPLTFGLERTYSLEELIEEKRRISRGRYRLLDNSLSTEKPINGDN